MAKDSSGFWVVTIPESMLDEFEKNYRGQTEKEMIDSLEGKLPEDFTEFTGDEKSYNKSGDY